MFQGFQVSMFQVRGFGVSRNLGFRISSIQRFKVSVRGFKVSRFLGIKVLRFLGMKVSRFREC
jgi:hypothetical protein